MTKDTSLPLLPPPANIEESSLFSSSSSLQNHNCIIHKKSNRRSPQPLTCEEKAKTYRILLLGGTSVGKTAIISQLLYDTIPADHTRTVQQMYGGHFGLCGPKMNVEIEDTSGSYFSDFPVMFDMSLKSADGVLLVFDVSSPESFAEVALLRDAVQKRNATMPLTVVANKSDLVTAACEATIPATVIDDWECGFVECSARENVNISEAFKELLSKVKTERGDGLLQVGSVSRHCFVRTQSSPAMPGQDTRESGHKLRKRQTCSIS